MHMYAECEQTLKCDSRVMSILLTDHGRTDSHRDDKTPKGRAIFSYLQIRLTTFNIELILLGLWQAFIKS